VRIRGPWLARLTSRKQAAAPEVLVRAPATLRRRKYPAETLPAEPPASAGTAAELSATQSRADSAGQPAGDAEQPAAERGRRCPALSRLDPLSPDRSLPGWQPPQPGMQPLWLPCNEPTEPVDAYLTPAGLERFLDGGVPEPDELIEPESLFGFDRRSGTAIDPDSLATQEGQLYCASFLSLRPGVAMYAELELDGGRGEELFAEPATIRFGGEGRGAKVRRVDPLRWPDRRAELAAADPPARCLILLTTPAPLARRWQPAGWPPGCKLIAACVPGYEPVSGWDLARGGPKPARYAIPAGSAFFLLADSNAVRSFADSLADDRDDQQTGWGCYVTGVWNYA